MKKLLKLMLSVLLVLIIILPSVQTHAGTEYSVKVGSKIKLKSSLGKVKWGSEDTATATVTKKGVVKGISEGTCFIVALGGGKTELFKVTVINGKQTAKTDDKLVNTGLEAIRRMKECTTSELYRKMIFSSEQLWMEKMVGTVKAEDVTEPKAIYEVKTDYQILLAYMAGESSMPKTLEEIEYAPDSVRTKMEKSFISSIPTMINSKQGSKVIAFVSAFSESGNILYEAFSGRRSFIFVFENGYPVWVTFMSGDEGIVSYTAQWIYIKDDTDLSSEEEVINSLYLAEIPYISVSRLK